MKFIAIVVGILVIAFIAFITVSAELGRFCDDTRVDDM